MKADVLKKSVDRMQLQRKVRIDAVYYSLKMSGNRLTYEQVEALVGKLYDADKERERRQNRSLDARKRAMLTLFVRQDTVTAKDVELFFNVKSRTARHVCQQWVEDGFFITVDPSKKLRTYALAESFKELV